jgi:tetratricopeptide (TPR) repeat protein
MSTKLKLLQPPDSFHLEAAAGWLELGNHLEAHEELACISPKMRAHPYVLEARWKVYAKAKKWEMAADVAQALTIVLPEDSYGWNQWAFSLHELKRTKEAWDVLEPIADQFRNNHVIRYNLACYSCQLGNLKEALRWLEKAIELAGNEDIRTVALDDPDLEPIKNRIGGI